MRIYLTIPVTTATVERSLSAVRCIKTYLRSAMSQQRLNNIMFLNVHKDLTDGLDLPTIARQFVDANERRRHFFGTLHSPQWNPPERLGLTLGSVKWELFGNLTACILLYYANDYCIYDCRLHDWLIPHLLQLMSSLLLLSIAFIFVYSLLQTLSCVLSCYSELELACLWPSKYM